ncbi:MAG TPA: capsular polysaccharide synthesis protein, partial [Candidatus Binatia bacterium]|nr:capsular polysaccharide synthesis protein [Candidatus Binatia bacterium]
LCQGISVVTPHGGVERLPHLGASLANLAQARGVSEVIVAEMGAQPCAARLARRWGAKYVFIHNSEVFERARALNTGAALAEFDLVLWKDNDLLLPESFAEIAAAELRSRNLDHLLPYEAIRYLNAADSRSVIAGTVAPATCKPARVLYGGRDVSGGAALVRSDFLFRFGGIPDMFRGWGGEDNAWMHKASLFGRTGVTQRSGQYLFHLHHADSGAFAGRPLSTNPYYSENVAMLGRLRAIASKEEFLQRFPDSSRRICPWDKSRRIALLYAPSGSAAAASVERGLRDIYGIGCAAQPLSHDWILECADAEAIIAVDPPEHFLREADAEGLWPRILMLVTDSGAIVASRRALLERARAAVVLDTAMKPGEGAWAISAAKLNDPIGLAKVLVQPLSLLMAGDKTRARQSADNLAGGELPVWVYWEGECPEWIRLCQQTIRCHAPGLRLLDRAAFETLWDIDRDIHLERLQTAHRSDFVRAFLLARFGGLWIDSDCIVMQPLTEILASLRETDFVAHRDRQGFYPNGFIGARPNSIIASELYQRVCERLRAGRPLGWISLGGEPLTEVLRTTTIKWRELPCETIQPVCWSQPEVFFEIGSPDEHELKRDPSALCYMLSNTEVQKFVAKNPERKILADGTFFRYLIKRSLETDAEDARVSMVTSPLRIAREVAALLETISKLQPRRILEIGVGTGIRGLLIRESYGDRESDIFELAGVTSNGAVKLTVREDVYSSILQEPLDRIHLLDSKLWDLVILGSGWEAATELAIQFLKKALEKSAYVLLFDSDVSPELTASLVAFSDDLVCAMPADEPQAAGPRHFLFSRNDSKRIARRHRIGRIFEQIFRDNCRRRDESVSGPGSCLAQTYEIRQRLPFLFADLGIETLLDAGCGDFHWLQHVDLGLKEYIGIDIVGDLIARNRQQFGLPNRRFILADLTEAPLPRSDFILCRDCLVHFSFADIVRILRNFGRSGSMYLLTTTFPERAENQEIATGDWRTLNLERAPFHFPAPMRIINERCTERGGIYADKSLGLWRLSDICL